VRPSGHDPSAELRSGFTFQEEPASRAARPSLPHPARRHEPGPDAAAAQPAPTRTGPHFHAARPSLDEIATMVMPSPFRVEGWHAPAGRRTREPRPLPRPGRSDRQRRWVPETTGTRPTSRSQDNPDGVRPDNRSDQVPAPTLRPYPRKTTEAGPKHSSTSSLPTMSLREGELRPVFCAPATRRSRATEPGSSERPSGARFSRVWCWD
jgi:hypothetical protein